MPNHQMRLRDLEVQRDSTGFFITLATDPTGLASRRAIAANTEQTVSNAINGLVHKSTTHSPRSAQPS
jgi:hypothetical protein